MGTSRIARASLATLPHPRPVDQIRARRHTPGFCRENRQRLKKLKVWLRSQKQSELAPQQRTVL
jgi:hypothetical protein